MTHRLKKYRDKNSDNQDDRKELVISGATHEVDYYRPYTPEDTYLVYHYATLATYDIITSLVRR